MLGMYRLAIGDLGEIERGAVLDGHRKEGTESARRGQTHDLAEERSGLLRVTGMHDGVVERDRHVHILHRRPTRSMPNVRSSCIPSVHVRETGADRSVGRRDGDGECVR